MQPLYIRRDHFSLAFCQVLNIFIGKELFLRDVPFNLKGRGGGGGGYVFFRSQNIKKLSRNYFLTLFFFTLNFMPEKTTTTKILSRQRVPKKKFRCLTTTKHP